MGEEPDFESFATGSWSFITFPSFFYEYTTHPNISCVERLSQKIVVYCLAEMIDFTVSKMHFDFSDNDFR